MHLSRARGSTQWDSPTQTEALTPVPGSHPTVGGWARLLGLLLMKGLWGARLRSQVQVWGARGHRMRVLGRLERLELEGLVLVLMLMLMLVLVLMLVLGLMLRLRGQRVLQ